MWVMKIEHFQMSFVKRKEDALPKSISRPWITSADEAGDPKTVSC